MEKYLNIKNRGDNMLKERISKNVAIAVTCLLIGSFIGVYATGEIYDLDYLNFGSTVGSSGYGIRDNSGDMEYKDSGGSWIDFDELLGLSKITSSTTKTVGTGKDYTTIQDAVDYFKDYVLCADCTISIDAGTYNEQVEISNLILGVGGSLTITGAGNTTIIDAQSTRDYCIKIVNSSVTLKNLKMQNAVLDNLYIQDYSAVVIDGITSTGATLSGIHLYNKCVLTDTSTTQNVLTGNKYGVRIEGDCVLTLDDHPDLSENTTDALLALRSCYFDIRGTATNDLCDMSLSSGTGNAVAFYYNSTGLLRYCDIGKRAYGIRGYWGGSVRVLECDATTDCSTAEGNANTGSNIFFESWVGSSTLTCTSDGKNTYCGT